MHQNIKKLCVRLSDSSIPKPKVQLWNETFLAWTCTHCSCRWIQTQGQASVCMEVGLQLQVVFPHKEGGTQERPCEGWTYYERDAIWEIHPGIRCELAIPRLEHRLDGDRAARQVTIESWRRGVSGGLPNEKRQLSKYLDCSLQYFYTDTALKHTHI